MEVTQEEYQKVVDQLNQLQEEYDQLNMMFENMGQGYEEALKLYDQAMESSRMKTDFIQQISHEIRTPLNILSGFTQILTTPGMELDEATQKEVSQGIADNTNRITNLMNKMLELADEFSAAGARLEMELLENEYGDNGFDSEMEYAEGLFDKERIERFHDLYVKILEGLIRKEEV
jgi:signal transduction histidine kinase